MTTIRFKRLRPEAMMPTQAHAGDCFDIYAAEAARLVTGRPPQKVRTGIAFQLPEGFRAVLKEKSGHASAGLHILGGVIDQQYVGEVIVVAQFIGDSRFHEHAYVIEAGEKICQVKFELIEPVDLVEADELTETARGASGFGSTGR